MGIAALVASAAAAAATSLLAFSPSDAPHGFGLRLLRRSFRVARAALARLARSSAAEAVTASRFSSQAVADLRAHLFAAGLDVSASESGAALLVLGGAAALIGIVLAGSIWGAAVGAASFAVGVAAWSSRKRIEYERALSSEMPAVYRSLAVSLGSGLTLSQAIAYVGSREESVAAPAFAHCSLRLMCGDPYDEVLDDLAGLLDTPGIGLLSSALAISHQTGSPLQGLFMRSAALVERAGELERMLAVKTAQVRLSVRVVCLLPALIVAILLMISPDFQEGISTPSGFASIVLACCMDLAAVLIVRSLSKGII